MTTTTPTDIVVEHDRVEARQQRLAAAVQSLRTRAGGVDGARLLLVIGGVLIPLGVVLIVLGWWGAANTPRVFEQIPYAISGGLLGLALVFAGGFTYFAYWLTQLVYAVRRDAADNRAVLERIETLLASGAAVSAADRAAAPSPNGRAAPADGVARPDATPARFLATATGTMFHRPDCPAVTGRDGLRHVTGEEAELAPCRICEPAEVAT